MSGELKILFHATFREITGKREVIEKINYNCAVISILEGLTKKYGKDFNNIIDPNTGKISTEILVMLNGRGIRNTDIKLKDKDVLVITLPLGGG
ncbi:MAG: MoaD family protein [Candidatus Hodarchaeales archaeon]|jgi:MoaD family protein